MAYTDPTSSADWYQVAEERSKDAALLSVSDRHLASYYFHGFAAECYAKSLASLKSNTIKSHNIVDLLIKCGIQRRDIPTDLRATAEIRDVSIRYQASWPDDLDEIELNRIEKLSSWIKVRVTRGGRKRHRRANRAQFWSTSAGK